MTTTKTTKSARKFYALNWHNGCEFFYSYKTIPLLDFPAAALIKFDSKADRDEYVDRRHSAESIPASIASWLMRQGVHCMHCMHTAKG